MKFTHFIRSFIPAPMYFMSKSDNHITTLGKYFQQLKSSKFITKLQLKV